MFRGGADSEESDDLNGEEVIIDDVHQHHPEDLLIFADDDEGHEGNTDDDRDSDDTASPVNHYGDSNQTEPLPLAHSRLGSDFEVLCSHGHGAFGQIIICKHIIDGKQYAIKRIPILMDVDTGTPMEIYALSLLQHPGIVRYYQSWREQYVKSDHTSSDEEDSSKVKNYGKDCHYIQMELCSQTLEDVWKDEVDVRKAWHFLTQIAESIYYMHQKGILHCDLSTKNILLDNDGENVKIIDFGLAQFKDGANLDGVSITVLNPKSLGNTDYRAPEMMDQRSRITEKVDVYSIGVIAIDLFHATVHERQNKRRELVKVKKLPSCFDKEPAYIREILLKLVDVDPDSRPTAEALFRTLSNHKQGVESMLDANMEFPVIVVRRASKSFGLLVVLALLKARCKVLVNFAKSAEDDNDVLEKIELYGAQIITFKGDTDVDADRMFRKAEDAWGRVDVFVNDAGCPATTFLNSPRVDNCTQAAAKIMLRNNKGRIINIASVRKDYVIDITKVAANKYAGSNIRVNAIVPKVPVSESLERWSRAGEVTDLVKALGLKDVASRATEQIQATPSFFRRHISATSPFVLEEAARLVVLLVFPVRDPYLNGQVLTYGAD